MNLYLHGEIYGYKPYLATPSIATGKVIFDFADLPSPSRSIKKRSVFFGNNNNLYKTEIGVDNTTFTSDVQYSFVCENSQYQAVITRNDGSVFTQPSSSSKLEVDLYDFKQEKVSTTEFKLPSYAYNSYYSYTFNVTDDKYISKIDVYIKNIDDEKYSKYEVKNVKYLTTGSDLVVFFNRVNDTEYRIDFGSGTHGKWVPGADVRIDIYETYGEAGNFSKDIKCVIENPEQAIIYDELNTGEIISTVIDSQSYFSITFSSADGGSDPVSGNVLRNEIINYIQTRDNFISERDFYNIIEKYTTDFRLLNKKTQIQENIIYLLRAIRDEYQIPLKTTNIMKEIFSHDTKITNINYETYESGTLEPGEYLYRIFAFDSLGNIISSEELSVSLLDDEDVHTIKLSWDRALAAIKYQIYLRDDSFLYYYETTDNFFIDNGDNTDLILRKNELPSSQIKQVVFPEINYEDKLYISPFMLKYNENYNMYDGYLFYPELLVNFSNIIQNKSENSIVSVHPSLFLNIIYENYTSYIRLKSYQDLEGWEFKITIPDLNIESLSMNKVDDNTFEYIYTDNSGILKEKIIITISCYYNDELYFTAKTNEITQAYYQSDQLQFPIYTLNNISYIIDLPIIEKDKFIKNQNFYLDKIYDFLYGFNFEENRMISDNLGFRFLNTNGLYSFMALNSFKQGGNLLKGYNYFDTYIPFSISSEPNHVPTNNSSWIISADRYVPIEATVLKSDSSGLYANESYGADANTGTDIVSLPYQIIISGDYTLDIRSMDVIRIKDSSLGLNGTYRVISVYYDTDLDKTYITTFDKLPISSNDGKLYFAEYEPWKSGGPDNIATWNEYTKSWLFTDISPGTIITVNDKNISTSYIYNYTYNYIKYSVLFPLHMRLIIDIDRDVTTRYGIDLDLARDQLKLEISKYLQLFLTGTDVSYYPSALIDFIMETRRGWIKHIKINVYDDDGKEILDGIETNTESVIQDKLSNSKLDMLNYTSIFVNWNVDDIDIVYTT